MRAPAKTGGVTAKGVAAAGGGEGGTGTVGAAKRAAARAGAAAGGAGGSVAAAGGVTQAAATAPKAERGREARLPVLEIFGPTVQGEGMVIGRKTMFVRTAGCDYRCSWCDSAFTWDGSAKDDIRPMSAADVMAELRALGGDTFGHVTLSGGNPALLPQLGELIDLLHAHGMLVALETQGSRWQDWFWRIDELTLSPKPPSSGMATDWAALDAIVSKLASRGTNYSLKVVVFDEADLAYARRVHERYPEAPFCLQAGNGNLTEAEPQRLLPYLLERYEWLIERTMRDTSLKQVRVLPQLHTWIWGNKKGV